MKTDLTAIAAFAVVVLEVRNLWRMWRSDREEKQTIKERLKAVKPTLKALNWPTPPNHCGQPMSLYRVGKEPPFYRCPQCLTEVPFPPSSALPVTPGIADGPLPLSGVSLATMPTLSAGKSMVGVSSSSTDGGKSGTDPSIPLGIRPRPTPNGSAGAAASEETPGPTAPDEVFSR